MDDTFKVTPSKKSAEYSSNMFDIPFTILVKLSQLNLFESNFHWPAPKRFDFSAGKKNTKKLYYLLISHDARFLTSLLNVV